MGYNQYNLIYFVTNISCEFYLPGLFSLRNFWLYILFLYILLNSYLIIYIYYIIIIPDLYFTWYFSLWFNLEFLSNCNLFPVVYYSPDLPIFPMNLILNCVLLYKINLASYDWLRSIIASYDWYVLIMSWM